MALSDTMVRNSKPQAKERYSRFILIYLPYR